MNNPIAVPTAHLSIEQKESLIETLASEIRASVPEGSVKHQFAALIIMSVMDMQGRKVERKGRRNKK